MATTGDDAGVCGGLCQVDSLVSVNATVWANMFSASIDDSVPIELVDVKSIYRIHPRIGLACNLLAGWLQKVQGPRDQVRA